LQFFPTDPVTVMLPIGKLLESRRIAVLALESAEKAGEVILIAAVVVKHGMRNSNRAQPLNLLRERFHPRRTQPEVATNAADQWPHPLAARQRLQVGLSEVVMKSKMLGDELYLCTLPFKPGQLICGVTRKGAGWRKKPEGEAEGPKRPRVRGKKKAARIVERWSLSTSDSRRTSIASSLGQSPLHGLIDDGMDTDTGSTYSKDDGSLSAREDKDPGFFDTREVMEQSDSDFCDESEVVEKGDPKFCEDRQVLEHSEPEMGGVEEDDVDMVEVIM
jgi:hypothetical protein